MKILSIKMQNFMLFRKLEIDTASKTVIGIVAEHKIDRNRSNKGGKSTLLEGIRYCLFGDSRAPKDTDLIHRGQDVMFVEIVLGDEKTQHIIKRGRDSKNHGFLEFDSITGTNEAQEAICELLGHVDATDFTLTRFFLQQDINQFMDTQPRQKQKYLMQWLKNDHWLVLERKVLDDLLITNKKILGLKSKLELLNEQSSDVQRTKFQIKESEGYLSDNQALLVTMDAKILKLAKLVLTDQEHEELVDQVQDLEDEIRQELRKLDAVQECKDEITLIKEKIKAFPKIAERTDVECEKRISSRIHSLKSEIKLINDRFTVAKKAQGICPLLKEKCDRIKPSSRDISNWEADLEAKTYDLAREEKQLRALYMARDEENRQSEVQGQLEVAKATLKGHLDSGSNLTRLRADLVTKKKQIKSGISNDTQEMLSDLKHKRLELIDLNEEIQEDLGALRERQKNSIKTKKRIDKIGKILAKKQNKALVQKYVAYMFGRNGIPAQEIENGFESIEDETNYVLRKFGSDLSIKFEPTRELKAWEPACVACGEIFARGAQSFSCVKCGAKRQKKVKDELTVKVIEAGDESDFQMESGGGKTIISFSNRLALTRLKQRKSHSEFNVLFLDEPDSALDKPNKRAFMDLVTKTLIAKFGFEQIFWITHDRTIQEYTPDVLKITRFEKHSVARWL